MRSPSPLLPFQEKRAAQRAALGVNYGACLVGITDGTSNAMVFGEYPRSRSTGNDQRGMS